MARRQLRRSRGIAIVEFALILPLFFMFVAAIIDFGILLFVQHTLQFATREGARIGLVGRTLTDQNGNAMTREASIIKEIRDNASVAMKPGDVDISIYPINDDYTDPAGWQGTQDAGQGGKYMRVRTSYVFSIPLVSTFVTQATLTLTAQATYRNEFFNS